MPTAWVPGFTTNSSPTSAPGPVTKLMTPLGSPASWMHSASLMAVAAAVGAGVQQTVLPMTIAKGRYSPGIAAGKFQGVMTVTTPRGCQKISTRFAGSWHGFVCASKYFACSAATRQGVDVSPASNAASWCRGLPSSVHRMSAISF